MVNFGHKIKLLRNEHGLTQKQLADLLGVAVSAISSYENDNRYPTYDNLITMTRIFHVTADYILGLEKVRTIDVTGLNEQEIKVVADMIEMLRDRK